VRLLAAGALVALTAGCGLAPPAPRAPWEGPMTPQTQAVEKAIDKVLRHSGREEVAVAYLDIKSGSQVLNRETQPFHAASEVKLPVLMAMWAAIDGGEIALDAPLRVHDDFRSIVDGSRFHLVAADDADAELYAAVGSTRPVSDLMRRMILRNSDLATNLLVERLTASGVTAVMRRMGAYETHILRGVEDEKAFQNNFNNEVTAADLMLLMRTLAQAAAGTDTAADAAADVGSSSSEPTTGPVISHRAATAILELLEAPGAPGGRIAAGVPAGTPLAHKAADITAAAYHHDVALVFPPGESPYVLVLLTYGFTTEERASQVMTAVSQAVWQARHAPPPVPKKRR
jgi:beta-lactamase class A